MIFVKMTACRSNDAFDDSFGGCRAMIAIMLMIVIMMVKMIMFAIIAVVIEMVV